MVLFFFFFGHTTQHEGFQFPNQGLHPRPLQWKRSLNHWTASEVPDILVCILNSCQHPSWGDFSEGSWEVCLGTPRQTGSYHEGPHPVLEQKRGVGVSEEVEQAALWGLDTRVVCCPPDTAENVQLVLLRGPKETKVTLWPPHQDSRLKGNGLQSWWPLTSCRLMSKPRRLTKQVICRRKSMRTAMPAKRENVCTAGITDRPPAGRGQRSCLAQLRACGPHTHMRGWTCGPRAAKPRRRPPPPPPKGTLSAGVTPEPPWELKT